MPAQPAPPTPSRPPSSDESFVHLHVHTEYSMLDGAARIDELLESAAAMGMPAIATTDHGYVFGAYEFWSKARKHGIKPIIGVEAYLTPGTSRRDRTRTRWGDDSTSRDDVGGGGAYTHMTLLARTTGGMHNLFRMSSLASLEGHYFKPRIDRELLNQYSGGLVATTGCVGGEIQTRLRLGQYDQARAAAAEFQDIFGKENFYAEVMDHGIPIERQTQKELLRLAKDLQLPLVATNDLHYTQPEHAKAHAALLCVQSGSTLMDPSRFKFDADEFYLKSAQQMRHLWRELPEACDNTLRIAEQCDVTFVEGEGRYMPRFPCPEGENEESWFVKEVERGLRARYPDGVPEYASKQARYETEVILGKGYAGLLPRRRRLHQLGQGPRHPRRSGTWLRRRVHVRLRHADHRPRPRRARPRLRAVPQPRAALDARLRRRLRRAPPRRGDPLRHPEVRRGAGRPDRHLRHHQGQAGGQGRRPGHGPPLRDGGEAHQGDAAADHGQGHGPVGRLRPQPIRATTRAPTSARCTRRTSRPRRSSRPPWAWRG